MKGRSLAASVAGILGTTTLAQAQQDAPQIAPPGQIEEVFVLGEFIPDEKRDTSEIANILDVEDLSKLGESSIGVSLSRVTGLSLVGGKYVYVRGLGERYSSTLLNNTRISSPVPFQKTVPLDIIPNKIVESLLVQKTYSAQYPGDFSGGVIDIRTKSSPDEDFANVKLTLRGNSVTSGGAGLYYDGGGLDEWGYDDGTRDIPENIQGVSSERFEESEFPQRAAYGASFYNRWDLLERSELYPNYTGEVEVGKRLELGGESALGFLGSFRYSHDWQNRDTDFRRYEFTGVDGSSNQTVDYEQETTRRRIGLNAFATLGYEFDYNNSVSLTYTLMRQTDDEVQQLSGLSSEDGSDFVPVRSVRLQWVENEIETWQLTGEHFFPALGDAELDWRIVDGSAGRDSPDTRTYTYAENRDGLFELVTPSQQAAGDLRTVFQAPERNFAELDDSLNDYGFDFRFPVRFGDIDVSFNVGASYYERTRESEDRLFRFDLTPDAPDYVSLMVPNQLFSLENFQNDWVTVRDFSAGAANASGIFPFAESGEELLSYYAQFDAQLTDRLRWQGGVRYEDVELFADAWGGNTEPGGVNSVSQDYQDWMPATSITYEFIENMQIRVAYSQTVNRPSLLEITGTTIRNPENFQLYRGNVFVQPAELESWDARWEWYFGAGDSMSLGVFYKEFDDPIEQAQIQAQNLIYTWFNAEEAELEGIEYDFRKELLLADWFDIDSEGWNDPVWNNFVLSANISYIDSNVVLLGEGETAADVPITGGRQIGRLFQNERPLTGQSDWLGNVLLAYEDEYRGITASIAYNYTGEYIALVGAINAPDVIQEARGRVDLLFRWNHEVYGQDFDFEFKAQNVFDEPIEWTQGGQIFEKYDLGVTYSVGLRANF